MNKMNKIKNLKASKLIKIIQKYPDACLETCGDKSHQEGCYINLKKNKQVTHSEEINVILDFDKNNKIVGIDLGEFSW